jgi:hypothetical protein
MQRAMFLAALATIGCAQSHEWRPEDAGDPEDAASVRSDAGSPPAMPDAGACDTGMTLERERCVGWLPAASLPPLEGPLELVQPAWGGEYLIRAGDTLLRYVAAEDRFTVVEDAGAIVPAAPPSEAQPAVPENEYGRVLGWLEDGTRVVVHVRYWAVTWEAERDDRGLAAWQPTVGPDFLFMPAIAFPIDRNTILFAGGSSALYVIR